MGKSVGVGVSAAGRVDYYSVERSACIPAAKASVELQRFASIDELTGLYNRRYLGELLDKLCKGENAFAVFYMDLNHFKAVNDELGHAAGDAILKEASERMRSCAGGDNPTARIGGDEFVVVCPGSRLAEIKNMESRLQEVIEKPFYVDGECRQLSLSIGIAVFPEDGNTYDSLMQKADQDVPGKEKGKSEKESQKK
ncbi:MAG: GGDEF domain-containing protein [Eisenbergiella massiliensis]